MQTLLLYILKGKRTECFTLQNVFVQQHKSEAPASSSVQSNVIWGIFVYANAYRISCNMEMYLMWLLRQML